MEVGEEGVDRAESVAGGDEDIRLALGGVNRASGLGDGLEGAGDSGANGHHSAAGGAGTIHGLGGFGRHAVGLGVHDVVLGVLDRDGAEGSEADVEGEEDDGDALRLQAGEHGCVEVEAGGRGGDGAAAAGVDRLVALAVGGARLAADVGRQRWLAQAREKVVERFIGLEEQLAEALLAGGGHRGAEARAEAQRLPYPDALGRPGERLPEERLARAEEENLHLAAGDATAVQAGGDHARVVEDQAVAGAQVPGQVGEAAVIEDVTGATQDHHARGRPLRCGPLGDEVVGQVVIEKVNAHGRRKRTRTRGREPRRESEPMGQLLAGTAQENITPPVGVDQCGFAARPGPSTGVHDDLMAKALYLGDGDGAIILITADIISVSHEQAAGIRAKVAEGTGVAADAVMITCSHTHSGPVTPGIRFLGELDEKYTAATEAKLAAVGIAAAKAAQPATCGWRREAVQIHINRRQWTEQGVGIGVNPRGTVVPWADVLAVDTAEGRPLARWFTHACHAVVLGGENLLISADWPGYAQRTIEAAEPGATALFAQGCCGDLNPRDRGTFEAAERLGKVVAGAAIKGAAEAERSGHVRLGHAARTLDLPLQDPPSVEEAQSIAERMEADYAAREAGMMYMEKAWYGGFVTWSKELVELAKAGVTGRTTPYYVQAVRIGDGAIIGLPGEVFAQYAINLGDASPARPTAVTGYTNGDPGYIPTEAAFDEGGYEVEQAFIATLPTMLTRKCEGLILGAAKGLVGGLF